jgi:hypothetical protein
MEEIVTVDGMQYVLTCDTPLTEEQKSQTISNIRKESGCGCGNKAAHLGGVHTLQGAAHTTINMLAPPNITVTDINIGGSDCPSGTCPDTICTSIGCATDTRNVVVRYENSGDIPVNIVPNIALTKTLANVDSVIRNGANRLVQTQKNDGTWQWANPNIVPTATEYPGTNNTLGVTARGLVKAYVATGEISYLNAAKKAADLLVSKTPDGFGPDDPGTTGKHKIFGQDITFLVEFADAWALAGGNNAGAYYSKANDYMATVLYSPNRFCAGGCVGHADQLVAYYYSDTPNLYGWDINGWVEAAVKTGYTAFAQDIVSNMLQYESSLSSTATGGYPPGSSYVLGLAGYLNSYIITGKTPTEYSSLKNKLLSESNTTDGSFLIYSPAFDGLNQATAYALMTLSITNEDMTRTVNYLINHQSPGGGWVENDNNEYTEEDSEIITALEAAMSTHYIGIPTAIPARSYVDITFNNVVLRRGANHVYADWTPSI